MQGGELPANPSERSTRWFWGILLVGIAARLNGLSSHTLWLDEANAVLVAQRDLVDIPTQLRGDSSPPAYYFALHVWMRLFGTSEYSVRSLSLIGGVGLIAATYFIARRYWSARVALWTSWFVATASAQTFYSQQARMYTFLPLLSLVPTHLLVRSLGDGSRRTRISYIATICLALYTHYFAFWVLASHVLLIVLARGRHSVRYAHLIALPLLLYIPWLSVLGEQLANPDHYAWFGAIWARWTPMDPVIRSLHSFSSGGASISFGWLRPLPGYWLATVIRSVFAVQGCFWGLRRAKQARQSLMAWPVIYLLIPPAISILSALALTPNYVAGRVDQAVFPAFALVVAMGVARGVVSWQRSSIAVGLGLFGLGTTFGFHIDHSTLAFHNGELASEIALEGDDESMAVAIHGNAAQGDVLVTTGLSRASVEYYLRRRASSLPILSYPRENASHLGSQNQARLLQDPRALQREAIAVLRDARARCGPGGRILLLLSHSPVNALIYEEVKRRFRVQRVAECLQSGTNSIISLEILLTSDDARSVGMEQ